MPLYSNNDNDYRNNLNCLWIHMCELLSLAQRMCPYSHCPRSRRWHDGTGCREIDREVGRYGRHDAIDREMICPLFIRQNTACCMVWRCAVHCTAYVKLWKAYNWNLYCSSFFMLLHLLQTSDRRQIFGHLRVCGIGCGMKKAVLCRRVLAFFYFFLLHGIAFVLTHNLPNLLWCLFFFLFFFKEKN